MNYYQKKKNEIRDQAICFSNEFGDKTMSWYELYEKTSYFYEMGKRYGLLTEFRDNAII